MLRLEVNNITQLVLADMDQPLVLDALQGLLVDLILDPDRAELWLGLDQLLIKLAKLQQVVFVDALPRGGK